MDYVRHLRSEIAPGDKPIPNTSAPHPVNAGSGRLGRLCGESWGCGQCPHFGSRTGPYWCRTGPDSVCFGGSPVFARAGTRFESHLGHSVSAGQGPFLVFFVCTLCTLPPLIRMGPTLDVHVHRVPADQGNHRTGRRVGPDLTELLGPGLQDPGNPAVPGQARPRLRRR